MMVAVAGCSGSDNGIDTSSPDAVVESFYTTANELDTDADSDEILDEVGDALHSESPLRDLLEETGDEETDEEEDEELENVDVEVTEEDLTVEEVEQRVGFFEIDDDAIEDIAEENAVVAGTIESEDEQEEIEHLTATEDGEWKIVL